MINMWASSYRFSLIINSISEIWIWADEDSVITLLDTLIFYPSIVTDSLWPSLSQWEKDGSLETLFSLYLSPLPFPFKAERITLESLYHYVWASDNDPLSA